MSERVLSDERGALDTALEVLSAHKNAWLRLPLSERLRLLGEMHDALRTEIDPAAWAADALEATGIPRDLEIPLATEMIVNIPTIAGELEAFIDTLFALDRDGAPPTVPVRRLPSGQPVADVYPRPWQPGDAKGPQTGFRAELRLQGTSPSQGRNFAARRETGAGQVSLVLGAGNQGFLAITDALHALFIEQQVVLLKHHPLRAYNDRWCQILFGPLIREGYFRSIVGDAEVAKRAVADPRVDAVHMTGGKATHDLIVWGEGSEAERQERKRLRAPVLKKPITSELGCVTPWIVAPGPYTDDELRHQAAHLATSFMQNNSANCCAPKVLVLSEAWPQRDAFLEALKEVLRNRPHVPPYYPGMRARFGAIVERYRGNPRMTQIESAVGPREFGPLGPALPWTLIEVPFTEATEAGAAWRAGGEPHPLLHTEPFCPVLAVCSIPGPATLGAFLPQATRLANEGLMGTLSCTVVVRDEDREAPAVQEALAELRYGTIGVNLWTGSCSRMETGVWGAFPGESIEDVASGIGFVRNALLFDAPEKMVVFSPLSSPGHIGTTPPLSAAEARGLVALIVGDIDTSRYNQGNPICAGNFRPISAESVHDTLEVHGKIPPELDGMYIRNGTNQRLPPTGKMHMFDGDAMLHCVRFAEGKVQSYANSWVKTPRFRANARTGHDPYTTFGDMTVGGLEVAYKLRALELRTKSGSVPWLGLARPSHPSTSTVLLGNRFFAVSEVVRPFEVFVDPATGVVTSGDWEDFSGRVDVFSAHSRTCPETGEVHYLGIPHSAATLQNAGRPPVAVYGVVDRHGELVHQLEVPLRSPQPLFLHDYFVTRRFMVMVDFSVRIDRTALAMGSPFVFRDDMNVQFGVVPRRSRSADDVRWFDLGKPGFGYHVVAGWEEGEPGSPDERLVLWLPIFDEYPSTMPIHVAEEPPSFLRRVVLDLHKGEVVEDRRAPGLEHVAGERVDVNRNFFGKKQRWAYFMTRAEGREMYDGFVKYDLLESRVHADVRYGPGRLGGEALFVPRPGGTREDEGWLLDIVYDASRDLSELCIWDAAQLRPGATEPVARVVMPHRVPFGVHGNFLTPAQLEAQWAGRPKA